MAEAIASVVVDHVVSIIEHQFLEEVNLVRGVGKKIIGLSEELKTIRNVLDDAEKKGAEGEEAVRAWLMKLENASYELEDVLDEWYTALRKFQIQQEQKCMVCNYSSFISMPSCFHKLAARRDIAKKLENVKQKIDSILVEKDRYGLVPTGTPRSTTNDWRVQTTSFVDMAEIYGRDIERDDLVSRVTLALLQSRDQTNHLQILSVVGVGGVGKTTLAQLVYNDTRVTECFELRIWICVSDPFDEVRVAKNIIECVAGRSPDSNQLEVLLQRLKECISGKKFLLVMDDVWTDDASRWKPLITSLKYGSISSKVLVTTRNQRVARMMGSLEDGIHRLGVLADENCWLLLKRIALFGRDGGEWKRFESIGMKIANKCKGLPLAAKALGSLLYFKNSLEEWENVLNSEIWELEKAEDEIFPHLRLSYNELSPTLKRCFSYCAVFPKDTRIDVNELIEHWMAVGYLGSDVRGTGAFEHRGRDYFDKLAMRCLFQDFEKDDLDEQIKYCKMHDIVHDFAQSLRKNGDAEVGTIRNTSTCKACSSLLVSHAKEYRSLYFGNEEPRWPHCNCLANLRVASLNNLGFWKQMTPHGIKRFIHLRWLDLSWNKLYAKDMKSICLLYNLQTLLLKRCKLTKITRKIGNLIHLRHLNLSDNSSPKELPCEIGNLIHLKHLDLHGNYYLKELPREIGNLIHLRHLDMSGNTSLKELPREIGNLIYLRHLNLSDNNSIVELPREIGNLIHLRHLNLSENYSLKELPESVCDLHELQRLNIDNCYNILRLPQGFHRLKNLKHLHNINNFSLEQFPQGVAQLTSLCTLNEFRGKNKLGWLKNLNRLSGSLRLFVDLFGSKNIVEDAREGELKKKDGIQELDIRFYGVGDCEWVNLLDALEPHPNLLKLEIICYRGSTLPSWMVLPALNKLKVINLNGFNELLSLPPLGRLPCLEEIVIKGIHKLEVVGQEFLGTTTEGSDSYSSIAFPKLKRLTFEECDNWREWEDITTIEGAAADSSCEAISSSVMPCLTELIIWKCKRLKGLPHRLLASLSSLEKLDISESTALEIRYGERQGSAWKSISDIRPCLQLIQTFCFYSIDEEEGQHGLVMPEIYGPDLTVERDDLVGRMVDQTNHLQILSIVEDGGVGATTLARAVYKDSRVRECFELRIWIRVSDIYLKKGRVAKAIIGSVTKKCQDSDELEFLVQTLKDCISGGKRFLLVMDDVLQEKDASEWEALISCLKNGSIGSKVLVTTAKESIAKVMGSLEDEIHHIGRRAP